MTAPRARDTTSGAAAASRTSPATSVRAIRARSSVRSVVATAARTARRPARVTVGASSSAAASDDPYAATASWHSAGRSPGGDPAGTSNDSGAAMPASRNPTWARVRASPSRSTRTATSNGTTAGDASYTVPWCHTVAQSSSTASARRVSSESRSAATRYGTRVATPYAA
ncbi:MAG TPA: hypothetical protein VNQ77_12915 [Frankiaceae bacterium]|nr:hypothetical protein [Frankiaceae bacterium]